MPRDDKFLAEYFKESQATMRLRSQVEYRLLQFLLLFYPIIGVIFATLYDSNIDKKVYLSFSIVASILLLGIALLVHIKIMSEHDTYRRIGLNVQKIWVYFGLFKKGEYISNMSMLPRELLGVKKGYGTGTGHKKTLYIVWAIAISMIALLITLGIIKFLTISEQSVDEIREVPRILNGVQIFLNYK